MNTPGNEPEDDVTAAYRRASDKEAGRPEPATRAAILAEARAASLRRTPAANESRYAWRAVAGLAVIGVAVLLWRQADRHVSPDLTVASTDRGDAATEAPLAPQVAADTSEVAAQSTAKAEMEEVPAAPTLERANTDAPTFAAGAARQDASDYQGLLEREFPEVWRGDKTASTVWVVMDAGEVARKGVISGADTLASVATGRGTWTLIPVKTASGSSLQLAVRNID